MKTNKKYALKILGAAALTSIIYHTLLRLLPAAMLHVLQSYFGLSGGLVLQMLVLVAMMVVAGLPAMYALQRQGVDRAAFVVIAGAVLAFVPSSIAAALTASLMGGWAWLPSQFLLIFLVFFTVGWGVRRRRRPEGADNRAG